MIDYIMYQSIPSNTWKQPRKDNIKKLQRATKGRDSSYNSIRDTERDREGGGESTKQQQESVRKN